MNEQIRIYNERTDVQQMCGRGGNLLMGFPKVSPKVSLKVPRRFPRWFPKGFFRVLQNASECLKMLQTASNCFKMLQTALLHQYPTNSPPVLHQYPVNTPPVLHQYSTQTSPRLPESFPRAPRELPDVFHSEGRGVTVSDDAARGAWAVVNSPSGDRPAFVGEDGRVRVLVGSIRESAQRGIARTRSTRGRALSIQWGTTGDEPLSVHG